MDTQHEPSKNEGSRLNERFVRWQDNLRQSLSSHITLITSWSAGGLAFCGALLNSDHARFEGVATCSFALTACSFILCLLLSLFISWNRLNDTRATLKILKARKDKEPEKVIEELQKATKQLGEKTWCVVYWQLWIFFFASTFLVITAYLAFKNRFDTCSSQ